MSSSSPNVFEIGKYATTLHRFEPAGTCNTKCTAPPVPPPKPLLIAMPTDAGDFPLLLFLHGYLLNNSFYSQLIQHVASHGFIVIAPQVSFFNVIFRLHNCHFFFALLLLIVAWIFIVADSEKVLLSAWVDF